VGSFLPRPVDLGNRCKEALVRTLDRGVKTGSTRGIDVNRSNLVEKNRRAVVNDVCNCILIVIGSHNNVEKRGSVGFRGSGLEERSLAYGRLRDGTKRAQSCNNKDLKLLKSFKR
jgi:hypothetical protein